MAYGETFKVGDRIVYDNFDGPSYGTIKAVRGEDAYDIEWDDGFDDYAYGWDYTGYGSHEITHVCQCVYPDRCFCPEEAKV